MSHDHEALHLAVASFDFDLSPEERLRMQTGLIECADCAETLASHHDLERLLARLPVHDASPYVRERVLRAALVPPRERRWPVLLAAAALLGLLLGVAAAAGAFRDEPPLDGIVVVPSASPPALGDEASPGPSTSPAPGASDPAPGASGPPAQAAPMTADTLAEVVSGRLRIRSEPRVADDSIRYEPLLDVGDRVVILDGPVVANDYEWYQVMAWRPGNLYASWPVGWVARGDHDGTSWLRPRADACPTGTITMEVVEALHPQERVACFGDDPLRLRAFVFGGSEPAECAAEANVACIDGPAWLTSHGGTAIVDASMDTPSIGGPTLAFDPEGRVPASALPSGAMVDLEGAFDHPAAGECRPGLAGPDAEPLAATVARLSCRARFVVTSVASDPAYPAYGMAGVTVSDNLRVRSGPSLTSERHELLRTGTRVWVIDGPVVAADYEWFQVIVPAVDVGEGAPRVGWVAASDHGAEPWLQRATLDCPDRASLTVVELQRLTASTHGDGGLACFGPSTIRLEGTVGLVCGVEDRPDWDMTPEWLSANALARVAIRDGDAVVIARPGLDVDRPVACGETSAQRYVLEGHFDDEAAQECQATRRDGATPLNFDLVPRYWCQTTFVIHRLIAVPRR